MSDSLKSRWRLGSMSERMLKWWAERLARFQEESHRVMARESLQLGLDKTRHPSRPKYRYVDVVVHLSERPPLKWTFHYLVRDGVPYPLGRGERRESPSVVIELPYYVVYYLLKGRDRQGRPFDIRTAYGYGLINYQTANPYEPLEGGILIVEDIFKRHREGMFRRVFGDLEG